MKCVISTCQNEASVQVFHAHPNADLQWANYFCNACSKEAFERRGTGEMIFGPIPKEKLARVAELAVAPDSESGVR